MKKILGMGNALVDVMTLLPNDELLAKLNLPKGSMQLVDTAFSDKVLKLTEKYKPVMTSGGSAANTIHGIARLGLQTGFIGKVGNDALGDFFKSDMEKENIHTHMLHSNTASGKAIALVTPDSERTFATYLGAAVELAASDIDPLIFDGYDYFHIEGYLVQNHELIETAIKIAKQKGLQVSLDLASFNVVEQNLDFLKRVVKEYVDIVFANEEEAHAFTGKAAEAAAAEIAKMCRWAIVKTGKKGSIIRNADSVTHVGIIPVKSIDTTGAGDLYAAGFLFGLANDFTIEKCGSLGALLAGKVIEHLGAKIADESWEYILKHV
jgi:sugar/nucleoside kinase (ribokinase family)